MHRSSTILPHLFNRHGFGTFACRIFRHSLGVAAVLLWASASAAQPPAPSDDVPSRPAVRQELTSTVLYRVFLQGGTALVSYGEFARVGDRVVLSIPIGELSDTPTLQLVSIPQSSVDWDRTDRYAAAMRARRYADTRGEADFALLGARVVEALNLISSTEDPARRLAMAQEARDNLARWPADNFGYRARDVAQLTGMLDDVISELRVAAGETHHVSLAATTVPPDEPMLAAPDLRESLEQAMTVAALTPDPGERVSLLRGIELALGTAPPTDWGAALSARAAGELAAELRIEKAYDALSVSTLAAANTRAANGDLRGVQALVERVLQADDRPRPETAAEYVGSARRARMAAGGGCARSRGA